MLILASGNSDMNSSFLLFFLFVTFFNVFQLHAVDTIRMAKKHKHVEHCLGSDGEAHALNQFWYDDGMCQRFYCFKDEDGILYEQITNCPIAIAEGDCKINSGTAGSYPDCCPSVVCPETAKAS